MKIPFLDLRAAYLELQEEIETAVLKTLRSGWYIGGSEVELFEKEFASYTETEHCVSVANGLDALHLSLRAMDIGPGDEVIVPSNTYIATWLAVSQCGATPVPVEPDATTYNIDPKKIAAAITEKTRAIIPVHLYGQPADLEPILALAKHHGLFVLEDAAQSHGARYKSKRIGGHGDIVAWSFYPGKNLGALGDGGAITTKNAELAEKVRLLRNYGSKQKYVHDLQGYNSRLDPVQAVVLRIKLKYLDEWIERRRAIAGIYAAELSQTSLQLPYVPEWAEPVWHLYVVQHESRDCFQRELEKVGVQTLIHYPIAPHRQQAYAALMPSAKYPIAERLAKQVISLPIGPQLSPSDLLSKIPDIRNGVGSCL